MPVMSNVRGFALCHQGPSSPCNDAAGSAHESPVAHKVGGLPKKRIGSPSFWRLVRKPSQPRVGPI